MSIVFRVDEYSTHIRMMMMLSSLGLQRRFAIVLIQGRQRVGVQLEQLVVVAVVHQLEWQQHKQQWRKQKRSYGENGQKQIE